MRRLESAGLWLYSSEPISAYGAYWGAMELAFVNATWLMSHASGDEAQQAQARRTVHLALRNARAKAAERDNMLSPRASNKDESSAMSRLDMKVSPSALLLSFANLGCPGARIRKTSSTLERQDGGKVCSSTSTALASGLVGLPP